MEIIKQNINGLSFKTWFEPIEPVGFDKNELTIKLPNDFSWDYIEVNFNSLIKKALLETIGENAKLSYIFDSNSDSNTTSSTPDYGSESYYPLNYVANSNTGSKFNQISKEINWNINRQQEDENFETNLNEKFTFDNFIKGEGNQLARAAAIAVANQPGGTSFNPLFYL